MMAEQALKEQMLSKWRKSLEHERSGVVKR